MTTGKAHSANMYTPGTQPNRLYLLLLARYNDKGNWLTAMDMIEAMGTTAPHTILSAIKDQLPDHLELMKGKREVFGRSVSAWFLQKKKKE